MGVIEINGNTVAGFENGTVYLGTSRRREVLGYYRGGKIENKYHQTVAKYTLQTAYDLDTIFGVSGHESGPALCHCSGSTIYEGGSAWNRPIGTFCGETDGACAATVLYLSYINETKKEEQIQKAPSTDGVNVRGNDGLGFWGGLIITALCLLVVYYFWFTEYGREMLFHEPEGIFVFCACGLSLVIGSYKVYKRNNILSWKDIAGVSAEWYCLALVLLWAFLIISCIIENTLTFGNILLTLFGAPFIVVGVAAPMFIVQVVILVCIKKKIYGL